MIRLLRLPINLDRNEMRPFHEGMSAARDRFLEAVV